MFSGIYFTFVTYVGHVILNKTDFLPPMLLGTKNGRMENLFKDFPIVADPDYASEFKNYYLLTLGYHIASILTLFRTHLKAARNDFREMFLHHVLTIALYTLSYLTNFTKIGAIIMFLHDWADIPTAYSKSFVELKGYETLTWVIGLSIVPIWFWSRLYVFP